MDELRKLAGLFSDPNGAIDYRTFFVALAISLLVSFLLSALYRSFYENRATGSQIHRSFILLGPAITALFIAIQYSLPLSLGLLGALSIIRFRTPIKEPEEIGFVMLLTACSVVIATLQLVLLGALLGTVVLGLSIRRMAPAFSRSTRQDGLLVLAFTSEEGGGRTSGVRSVLESGLPGAKLEAMTEADGLTSIHFSFCDLSSATWDRVRKELEATGEFVSINLYFNRSTSLL